MNRPLVMNAIGVTEEIMTENPINKWIGAGNETLLNDVLSVFKHGQPIFVSEYEIKGKKSSICQLSDSTHDWNFLQWHCTSV